MAKPFAYIRRLTLPEGFGSQVKDTKTKFDYNYPKIAIEKMDKIPGRVFRMPKYNDQNIRINYLQGDQPDYYTNTTLNDDYFVYFPYFPTFFDIKSKTNFVQKGSKAISALNYNYKPSNPIEVSFTAFFTNDKVGIEVDLLKNRQEGYVDFKPSGKELRRVFYTFNEKSRQIKNVNNNLSLLRAWTNPAFFNAKNIREPPYVELGGAGIKIRGRITSLKNKVTLYSKEGVPLRCYSTITIRAEPTTVIPVNDGGLLQLFITLSDKSTMKKYYTNLYKASKTNKKRKAFFFILGGEQKRGIGKKIKSAIVNK